MGQARLSGIVLDSVTRQPLPFSTVFLANTTRGVTTDEAGRFVFEQVPAGSYEAVASYLGYRLQRQNITVRTESQQLTFRLAPSTNALREVVVRPTPNKPEDYQVFADALLGSTSFSKLCRIRNPKAVQVRFDAGKNELTASCPDFLEIENRALGYRIRYYGLEFTLNFQEDWVSFYGSPVFEPLRARSARQQRTWEVNRRQAYTGSLLHFLRSAYAGKVAEAGFRVQRLRRLPHPAWPRADSLLKLLRSMPPEVWNRNSAVFSDSAQRLSKVPRQVEYLFTEPLPAAAYRQELPGGVFLRFADLLQVTFAAEPADPAYVAYTARQRRPGQPLPAGLSVQSSVLHLQSPTVELQPNGTPTDPLALLTEDYWGFEKMGEFLPLDYQP
ncbi:carboxypeptidase-like regulatory domain-containing protein [Hymenobacter guriensis]|uniref:Carboxypeptidase-like regulatory domain-containing protein n=1 Tax=Hymenobacter guriensis TaxID=2793065 RepID=A0ABS0L679_9BACT|nr:carboxypeptidase-like regulatory domain-containing protein [Hymenobacter guriensis]MBG8555612.1 carboxypeptidase-like regulatory domain-containing protein [Hymenobacter guriensis]